MRKNRFYLGETVGLLSTFAETFPNTYGLEMLDRKFKVVAIYDRGYTTYLCKNIKTHIKEEIEERYLYSLDKRRV